MRQVSGLVRLRGVGVVVFAFAALALFAMPASAAAVSGTYTVTALVSNNGVPGTTMDERLVNAWGLVAGPGTPWWVSDNGADFSTLYFASGVKRNLNVSVDGAHACRRLRRSEDPLRLRAVRDPDDRHANLRDVREAGRGGERRDRRPRPRLRRRIRHGWKSARPRGATRPVECAVGPGARAREFRTVRRRPAHRQLRQRPRERVPGDARWHV